MASLDTNKKILFIKCGNRCAFSECNQIAVENRASLNGKDAILIEAAHIKGEKAGSARYDSKMTNDERNDVLNLLGLCNVHHKLVDDQPDKYTVEVLNKMKITHESWVEQQTEKQIPFFTFAELEVVNNFLVNNKVEEEEYTVIPPELKIKKNKLSDSIANLIKMGLSRSRLVEDYINQSIDVNFGERLKQGFVEAYKRFKTEEFLEGDNLFDALLEFACGRNRDFKVQAAGLSVLSYFFEKCDIFEK